MSRCFPFPPPGYERKHRPEDLILLKEAKHKERKNKKEKKDKEKKRDKGKDKDGGDEKHRDKKDRKEKHKDKKEKHRDKKKEDRGKDKEKSSISEESTVSRKLEEESGGKPHPKGHSEDRSALSNEGKCPALFHGKPSQSSQLSQAIDDLKFVQELDRRIRDDENGRRSQLPQKVPVVDKRDQEMVVARAAARNSEEKVDSKNKRIDGSTDPQGFNNESSENKLVQKTTPTPNSKVKGIPRHLDGQNGTTMGETERCKQAGVVKSRDKQQTRDDEILGKEKEKRKEDTVKVKTENNKNKQQGKLKDDGRSQTSTDLLKNSDNNSYNAGKVRKREDMDTNGFLHESDTRPVKVQRSNADHSTENGRKLNAFRTPSKLSHDMHDAPDSVLLDKKDTLMNGITEVQKPFPSKQKSSVPTIVSNRIAESPKIKHDSNLNKAPKVQDIEDLIAETLRRPPHPDSKYLTDVLTVPNITGWSGDDDQEWLFRKKSPTSRRPKADSAGAGKENLHVWSEAVHIETADVCALPYVIPY